MNSWSINFSKSGDNDKRNKTQSQSLPSVLLLFTTVSVSCADFSNLKWRQFSNSLTVFCNQILSLWQSQLPIIFSSFEKSKGNHIKENKINQIFTNLQYLQEFTFGKLLKVSFQNLIIHWISSKSPPSACLLKITKTKCKSKPLHYTTNLNKSQWWQCLFS